MFEHLNIRVNYNQADYSDLNFSQKDKKILQELAKQVAEIAQSDRMSENKKLWLKHNKLETTRPVILADPENGWNEIILDKDIKCENEVARYWECHLRKQIYWGTTMLDDYTVAPYFDVPYVYTEKTWGVGDNLGGKNWGQGQEGGGAYKIDCILESYDQISQITKPKITINYELTNQLLDIAKEIFQDILEVRLNTVWFWSIGLTDEMVFLRGMQNLMFDFIDEPEKVHEVMNLLYKGTMEKLDYLENNNLFSLNNDETYVGSGGLGHTDLLPSKEYDGRVMTKDMWGLAESQVTVGISPDMFGEFIFPYQKKIMERFGLSCYGCCEPMDDRFDIIKSVSNLRRVSVSPWANQEIMGEKLSDQYIYSLKLSPTPLSVSVLDEDLVRKQIREGLKIAKKYNNHIELMMKDNHTLGNNPNNIIRWTQIAREEIDSM